MTAGGVSDAVEAPVLSKRYVQSIISTSEFRAGDFFQQTSRFDPADLERTLELVAEELQQELTSIVNREFAGFAQLFSSIGDVGQEELAALYGKVQAVAMAVKDIKAVTSEELAVLEGRLDQLRVNLEESRRVEFNLRLLANLDRLQACLVAVSEDPDRLNIELAAEFFTRAMSLVNAASGQIELEEEIKERLAIHVGRFFSLTEDALLMGLRSEDTLVWETVAGILIRLGKTGLLGDLISTVIVRPPLETLLSKTAFEEARRRTAPSQAIDSLFAGLLAFLKQVRAQWFDRLVSIHPGTTLFVESVLIHIFTGLTRNLSAIFSPAIPDTFHKNFTAGCEFIERIAGLLTPAELVALDGHECFKAYASSWQLNVYFQLRFRDLAQGLEDALRWAESVEVFANHDPAAPPPNLAHPAVAQLERACKELTSEQVLLRPLIPRFLKLRLQAISRVASWFREQCQAAAEENICQAYRAALNHQRILEMAEDLLAAELDATQEPLGGWLSPLESQSVQKIERRFLDSLRAQNAELKGGLEDLMVGGILKKISEKSDGSELCRYSSSIRALEDARQPDMPISKSTKIRVVEAIIERFIDASADDLARSRKAVANQRRLWAIMKDSPTEGKSADKIQSHRDLLRGLLEEAQRLLTIASDCNLPRPKGQLQEFTSTVEGELEKSVGPDQ